MFHPHPEGEWDPRGHWQLPLYHRVCGNPNYMKSDGLDGTGPGHSKTWMQSEKDEPTLVVGERAFAALRMELETVQENEFFQRNAKQNNAEYCKNEKVRKDRSWAKNDHSAKTEFTESTYVLAQKKNLH